MHCVQGYVRGEEDAVNVNMSRQVIRSYVVAAEEVGTAAEEVDEDVVPALLSVDLSCSSDERFDPW